MSEILERVSKVVADRLKLQPEKISLDKKFDDDLGADSLDMVDVAMGLEDEFGIAIPDTDYNQIKTIGDVVTYIESKSI